MIRAAISLHVQHKMFILLESIWATRISTNQTVFEWKFDNFWKKWTASSNNVYVGICLPREERPERNKVCYHKVKMKKKN